MSTFRYGTKSQAQLNTCSHELINIFNEVIKHMDCSILQGHRDEEAQNEAYDNGKSQLQWPEGNHNKYPSDAVDAIPYPIDWGDRERMTLFAGVVKGIGLMKGIQIRWGGESTRRTASRW